MIAWGMITLQFNKGNDDEDSYVPLYLAKVSQNNTQIRLMNDVHWVIIILRNLINSTIHIERLKRL